MEVRNLAGKSPGSALSKWADSKSELLLTLKTYTVYSRFKKFICLRQIQYVQ